MSIQRAGTGWENIMDMPINWKAPLKCMWFPTGVDVLASSLYIMHLTIDGVSCICFTFYNFVTVITQSKILTILKKHLLLHFTAIRTGRWWKKEGVSWRSLQFHAKKRWVLLCTAIQITNGRSTHPFTPTLQNVMIRLTYGNYSTCWWYFSFLKNVFINK